jgi:hypothetical protein
MLGCGQNYGLNKSAQQIIVVFFQYFSSKSSTIVNSSNLLTSTKGFQRFSLVLSLQSYLRVQSSFSFNKFDFKSQDILF